MYMLLSAVVIGLLPVGCVDDALHDAKEEAANATIRLSQPQASYNHEGGTFDCSVTSTREWSAYSDAAWLAVDYTPGTDKTGFVTVRVSPNTEYDAREGSIVIKSGTARGSILVSQAGKPVPAITCPLEGYTLVWNDEFAVDGSLDADSWTYQVAGPGWVNSEKQAYVTEVTPGGAKVAEVKDGTLRITCLKESGSIYSARVYAHRNTGWQYGYFEASICLPSGKGSWPAFWMMPVNFQNWPADGEIDIMEEVGYNPNVVVSTIHCNKYNNGGTSIESASRKLADAEGAFHKYAMEWTAEYMTFFVDDEPLLTYRNDGSGKDAWPFDAPFYPILNLAFGGSWGGAQGVDESCLPLTMEVDYVRVFQK